MSLDQGSDAVCDDARLAAACSGKQQERTFEVSNGFALLRI
jgi:hypothetical protein